MLCSEVYSCKYSTFLLDCERERTPAEPHLVSVWTDLFAEPHANPGYFPQEETLRPSRGGSTTVFCRGRAPASAVVYMVHQRVFCN